MRRCVVSSSAGTSLALTTGQQADNDDSIDNEQLSIKKLTLFPNYNLTEGGRHHKQRHRCLHPEQVQQQVMFKNQLKLISLFLLLHIFYYISNIFQYIVM